MAETRIADVIVPEIFSGYVINQTVEKSRLIQSGLAVQTEEFNALASGAGKTFHLPYWNDLQGDDEVLSDSGALSVNNIDSGEQIAVRLLRGKAFGSNDLAAALAGDDPMNAIASRVAEYWVRRSQAAVVKILDGLFDRTAGILKDSHRNAAADEDPLGAGSPVLISGDSVIDSLVLLGDEMDSIQAMILHSKVYATLLKNDLIDFLPDSEGKATIPSYLGKEVLVDDGMPVRPGDTSGNVYRTYLFRKGAFSMGIGQPTGMVSTETDRNSLAGYDVLVNRNAWVLHPNGISWQGTPAGVSPSNTELSAAANWVKAWEDKKISVIALETNG